MNYQIEVTIPIHEDYSQRILKHLALPLELHIDEITFLASYKILAEEKETPTSPSIPSEIEFYTVEVTNLVGFKPFYIESIHNLTIKQSASLINKFFYFGAYDELEIACWESTYEERYEERYGCSHYRSI